MSITHTKVSAVGDGGDSNLVRPSDWNAEHTFVDVVIKSPACNFSNLVVKNNVTNPTYQVDINADGGKLSNSTGNPIVFTTIDITVDITASGANGLDTGAEAGSTWYHIWAISNGSITAGLLSLSATAPTMPSGYTYKAYVGAVYNNASSNFLTFYQINNRIRCSSGSVGSLTSTTAAAIDLSTLIPSTAIFLHAIVKLSGSNNAIYLHPITFTAAVGNTFSYSTIYAAEWGNSVSCLIETSQQIYYAVGAGTLILYTVGWEY